MEISINHTHKKSQVAVREVSIIEIINYFQKASATTYRIYHDQLWHNNPIVTFNLFLLSNPENLNRISPKPSLILPWFLTRPTAHLQ